MGHRLRKSMFIVVSGTASEPEDEEVPGVYEVEVDAAAPEEEQFEGALDVFHEHIGIECLDDFNIHVMDAQGRSLIQGDDIALQGRHLAHASFLGRTEEFPEPR